jgi:hypothetical protein
MILIGSHAIKHYFPDFPREPKDKDYIIYEYQYFNFTSTREMEYLKNKVISDLYLNTKKDIIDINHLYTLKISHLFWDINWSKHMFDVQFLKKKGCTLDKNLFFELYYFWNNYHIKNKRSDLKMSAEDFFDNSIKCEYEHDYLHTILNPIPIYTKILKGEVDVCENKFNNLSYEDKLNLVIEEVAVMSYERYRHLDYRIAYSKMLKKFIINHAPLWEALFIIDNYIALHKINFNHFKKIEYGL